MTRGASDFRFRHQLSMKTYSLYPYIFRTTEKLLENNWEWQGTASDLLKDLTRLNSEVGQLINKPEGLGIRLSKVKFALGQKSIDLVRERTPGGAERLIRLSKRP
jgi:hypothetical protein